MEVQSCRSPISRRTHIEASVDDAEIVGELFRSREKLISAMVLKLVERFGDEMLAVIRKPMIDAMVAAIKELDKKG